MSKEAIAEAQKQETKFPSLMNIGVSDQTELKTMVDAIGAASEREAEAHEMAIFLSKENDELKMKLKVLIEDNNKLIDLYERAVSENRTESSHSSEIPWKVTTEDHSDSIAKADNTKEVEIEKEFEKLKCQLTEMHEENDKLLSLYEKAMLEGDELKKVIASVQNKNADDKGNNSCPERLVEVDKGQRLSFGRASVCFENEHEEEEMNSNGLNADDVNTGLDIESCLYEVEVQDDDNLCSIDSPLHNYCDSNEGNTESFAEDVKNYVAEQIEQNEMEIDEPGKLEEQEECCVLLGNTGMLGFKESIKSNIYEQDNTSTGNPTTGTDSEMREYLPNTLPMHVCEDLKSISMKLAEAREKLSYSAETVSIFGSFERAIIEVDALSNKIGKLECSKQAKEDECQHLQALSSKLHERKELANKKLLALKQSLTNFSSSLSYFEQREAMARSRLDASSQHLNLRKDELTRLQSSRQELVNALSKIKHTENELRSIVENSRLKVEEENRKLESERVLFAIDNIEKAANWQVAGKATALLQSEEEKTKLQNQIKHNREKLSNVRKEGEALNMKLAKMESEIEALEAAIEKETCAVDEMKLKLQNSLQEKEMLVEVTENGKHELESMLIEYHQSVFEADLKDEEIKIAQEELLREAREVEGLELAKEEVTRRKTEVVEAMSCDTCLVSDKVEAALDSLRTSVVELNSLLQHFGSV